MFEKGTLTCKQNQTPLIKAEPTIHHPLNICQDSIGLRLQFSKHFHFHLHNKYLFDSSSHQNLLDFSKLGKQEH